MKNDLTLPLPAERFIPHRPPMRLVETLISCDDAVGVVEATLATDSLLVADDGTLDAVAFVELLAQGYAVIKGYDDRRQGKEISEGYLVGVRKMRITGRARAGEQLLIRIRTIGSFEGFAVVEGEIENASEIIASGTLKLWIVSAGRGA
jgi:predicted hotdog family 3-hydroxylacyl-ACP dehydratase